MNCKPYNYIVGCDPVEKEYTWLEKAMIKLRLKKREFKTSVFMLCLNTNVFEENELIHPYGQEKSLMIIDRPKPTVMSSLMNRFRIYKNEVKFWNPVKMEVAA